MRISCCTRRIVSPGERATTLDFLKIERKKDRTGLIILAGSASLERKNKWQVPKREFPRQPQDKPSPRGPIKCPMCGCFLRRED